MLQSDWFYVNGVKCCLLIIKYDRGYESRSDVTITNHIPLKNL